MQLIYIDLPVCYCLQEERRYSDSFVLRESQLKTSDHDNTGQSEDSNNESVHKNWHRTSRRRHSCASLTCVIKVQYTEEQETDDEHFELERKLSRQKRQEQKSRRRSLRSAVIGEGEHKTPKMLLKQASHSDTEQYLLDPETDTEVDQAYWMDLATKRSVSTSLQTNNIRSRSQIDSRKTNVRTDDLGIRNYITRELNMGCREMCKSRHAMLRQDAVSYSSSSNSICSDVKPSDQFSALTSPPSSRYYLDMSQSSLCPEGISGPIRDQSPLSEKLKCDSSILPSFHCRSRRITLSQCQNININVEKTATSSGEIINYYLMFRTKDSLPSQYIIQFSIRYHCSEFEYN